MDALETLPIDPADLPDLMASAEADADAAARGSMVVEEDSKPSLQFARTLSLNSEVWEKDGEHDHVDSPINEPEPSAPAKERTRHV